MGTDEALLFSNSQRFENEFLRTSDDRLIGGLKKLDSADEQLTLMFRSILSRAPNDIERQSISAFLEPRVDRNEDALRQVVWALLSSPEFRFNH